jgi:hypothetical protein
MPRSPKWSLHFMFSSYNFICISNLLTHSLTHCPDDGGSKDLWNVGKLLPDYTALQPRRQPSSYSLPWEPQILISDLSHPWYMFCQTHLQTLISILFLNIFCGINY